MANINVREADAFHEADKKMIFEMIESRIAGGCDGLSSVVKGKLRDWLAAQADELVAEAERRGQPDVGYALLAHEVALVAHQQGRYRHAEELFRRCISLHLEHSGERSAGANESRHRLAMTLLKLAKAGAADETALTDEAEALLGTVVASLDHGSWKRLRARKGLGQLLTEIGQYERAVAELRTCIEAVDTAKMEGKRPEADITRQDLHCRQLLGVALRDGGLAPEEALDLHTAVRPRWAELDGDTHDNHVTARFQCALSLEAMGRLEDALAEAEQVLRLREVELGTAHGKYKQALSLRDRLASNVSNA